MSSSIRGSQQSDNEVIGGGSGSGLNQGACSQTNKPSDSSKDAINEALSRLERLKLRAEDFSLSEEQIRTNDQLQEDEVLSIQVFVWDLMLKRIVFHAIYFNRTSIWCLYVELTVEMV